MSINYCPECGSKIIKNSTFCGECGTKVKSIDETVNSINLYCPACSYTTMDNEKYCPECGLALVKSVSTKSKNNKVTSNNQKSTKPTIKKKATHKKIHKQENSSGNSSSIVKKATAFIGVIIIGMFGFNYLNNRQDDQANEYIPENNLQATSASESGTSKLVGTVDSTKTSITFDDINIDFGEFNLDKDTKINLVKHNAKIIKNECKITVVDVTLQGRKQFDDYLTISLPYDNDFIEVGSAKKNVSAKYYNEQKGKWEPVLYKIDSQKREIVIQTDHLSKFGVFVVKNEKHRRAYISDINIPEDYFQYDKDEMHIEIIEKHYNNDKNLGEKALSKGLNFWGTFSGHSGALINTLTVGGAYSTAFIENINKKFKNIGYAYSAIQLAYDLYRGDHKSAAINLTKNIIYQTVSEIGKKSLNLAFVGVYFIDYSITSLGNATMKLRYEDLFMVYDDYNLKHNKYKRSNKEWRSLFIEIQDEYNDNPKKASQKTKEVIDQYVYDFFNKTGIGTDKENATELAFLVHESGLKRIAQPLKSELNRVRKEARQQFLDNIHSVFKSISNYRINKMREELHEELSDTQEFWNQVVPFVITEDLDDDEESDFANHIVRFKPTNKDVTKKWTGRLNNRGHIQTSFSLLAHWLAGSPNQVFVYGPDDNPDSDDPILVKQFTIHDPVRQVTVYLEQKDIPKITKVTINVNINGKFQHTDVNNYNNYKHDDHSAISGSLKITDKAVQNNSIFAQGSYSEYDSTYSTKIKLNFENIEDLETLSSFYLDKKTVDKTRKGKVVYHNSMRGSNIPFKVSLGNSSISYRFNGDLSKYLTGVKSDYVTPKSSDKLLILTKGDILIKIDYE